MRQPKFTFSRFIESFIFYHEVFPRYDRPSKLSLDVEIMDYDETELSKVANRDLGGDYYKEVVAGVERCGTEAVAWYAPYHLYERWGIYIDVAAINGLAYWVAQILGIDFLEAFKGCVRAVLEHECFHFFTEYVASIIESMRPRWILPRYCIYLGYIRRSLRSPYGYNLEEEAIANAWKLTCRSRSVKRVKRALVAVCDGSPPGYRDYRVFTTPDLRSVRYDKVKEFWVKSFDLPDPDILIPTRLEVSTTHLLRSVIPIYYVHSRRPRTSRDLCLRLEEELREHRYFE